MTLRTLLTVVAFQFLSACEPATPPAETSSKPQGQEQSVTADAAATVTAIADRYYATALERTPEHAYFSGVELPRHDGMV